MTGPRLVRLGIRDRVTLHSSDPAEFRSVMDVVARTEPAEIYNLSGQTSVGESNSGPLSVMRKVSQLRAAPTLAPQVIAQPAWNSSSELSSIDRSSSA